ncbi:MAG: UV DNA damage repair endonuclease UvsE [Betaproteobacteria bacterium]|jgi:UV DNA damage endonuclease
MKPNFGYCCINTTLAKHGIRSNRSMIKRTFEQRGIYYASELALQNVVDLRSIIKWNIDNNIRLFRMGSELFPWNSEYNLKDLPDFHKISKHMHDIGQLIKISGIRVSFHPDHFVKLASKKQHVIDNGLHDLNHHAEIFDLMGLDQSHQYPINIHIGSAGGNKALSIKTFLNSFDRLTESAKRRLVVENDDKAGLYNVGELCESIGLDIPITFDYFHHSLNDGGISEEDAFHMCVDTWPTNITPLFHFSSSKRDNENSNAKVTAHADYIYDKINTYNTQIDIDLEAKAKELALFQYRELYENSHNC